MPLTLEHRQRISESLLEAYRTGRKASPSGRVPKPLKKHCNLWYLVGAFLGDGWLDRQTENGHGSYAIGFAVGTHPEFGEAIIRAVSDIGLHAHLAYSKSWHNCPCIIIYSKLFYEFLYTCRDVLQSNIAPSLDTDIARKLFLKGFYDAEGPKTVRRFTIDNTDSNLIQYISKLLVGFNLRPKICVLNRQDGYHKRPIHRISLFKQDTEYLFNNILEGV